MDQATKALLYCLSFNTNEKNAKGLEQLLPFDWDNVVQTSQRHGVAPLLYHRLKTLELDLNIPDSIMERLRDLHLHSAYRNIRLFNEFGKILKTLRDANIPVIVLKGAHLAEVVYDNIALRPMGDVDIMVKKTDLPKLVDKFFEMGYNPTGRIRFREGLCSGDYNPVFNTSGLVRVDIHSTIGRLPFTIDAQRLWEKTQSFNITGVKVLALSPENLLLHTCLHTSYDHLFKANLRSFCDISQTLWYYRNKMNWDQVIFHSHQWGLDMCVYVTLYLVRELLEAAVPSGVLHKLKPVDLDYHMVDLAMDQIFGESEAPHLIKNIAQLWGGKTLLNKIHIILKRLFPSPKFMAGIYPAHSRSIKIYFYYPVRLKDIYRCHRRAVWKMLHRDKKMVATVNKENTLREWLTSS